MPADLDFAEVVDRYYGPLYRFAYSLTGSEADACDLVQEAFYIWLRKGSQLQQAGKVKSWLFTTLHREFLQARRRTTRFPEVEFTEVEGELPTVAPDELALLDGDRVVQMLGQVDEVFRGPLALFYLHDGSYEEIGQVLGLPLGTVKSRLSRGVAHLRQLLARDLAAGGKEHCE